MGTNLPSQLNILSVGIRTVMGIGSPYFPKAEALIKLECSDVFFTKISGHTLILYSS